MLVNKTPSALQRWSLVGCLLIAFFLGDSSSPGQTPTPESRNPTAETLRSQIEAIRQQWHVPGLAVAVVKDDQVVLSEGFGVRQIGTAEAVDGDTLFAIASNSKAFTATALAILVDEGRLKWDDHVTKYLPWLRLQDPLASSELRIHDLLCHRSGLGTFSGDLLWWGTPYTPREVLERAVHLKPASSFRSEYGYSNLMFLAAGEVVREVSGHAWEDFVKQRILEPLKMKRTITSVRDLLSKGNFATPHKTLDSGSQPLPWMNWDAMIAAGGIISSSNDMSNWLRLQLRRGEIDSEARLFTSARSHEMWQAMTPMAVSQSYSDRFPSTHFRAYGLGWSLSDYLGKKMIGHGGGYDGMYSQVTLIPEDNLGIVVLTNSMTGISPAITYSIIDQYLTRGDATKDWSSEYLDLFRKSRVSFQERITKSITPAATGTQPSHPLEAYTGKFSCPMYGDCVIEQEGNSLVLRLLPNPLLVADLEHLHYDTYILRWRNEAAWFDEGTVHFVANAKGQFVKLELDVPNDDLWFDELRLSRPPYE